MSLMLLGMISGCAHHYDSLEPQESQRTRTTLIAIGGAILVGALIANQAQRNTRDALRDANPDN